MENNFINSNSKELIEKIYNSNIEEIDNILKIKKKEIKDRLKEIDYKILEDIQNQKTKKKIKEILDNQDENYNIKLSEYCKEMYRKGFKDAINIIIEALQ